MLWYPLGDGVRLGPLEPWHAEPFAVSVGVMREHLAPWVPFAHTVIDVESARQFLQRFADQHAADTRHVYAIWRDGAIVGGVMFPYFDLASGNCEVGVWLAAELQGRGIITRAVSHVIDWAVDERGMSRVAWHVNPRNERSRAVPRRLGMTREGVRRSAFVLAGERQDEEIWSVLAHEWRARARPSMPAAPRPATVDGQLDGVA
jgi:RimJ/RimL family protein N-acetyltransferase